MVVVAPLLPLASEMVLPNSPSLLLVVCLFSFSDACAARERGRWLDLNRLKMREKERECSPQRVELQWSGGQSHHHQQQHQRAIVSSIGIIGSRHHSLERSSETPDRKEKTSNEKQEATGDVHREQGWQAPTTR